MGILDIFSKRRDREAGLPDVYTYDDVPQKLRIQCTHILLDRLKRPSDNHWSHDPPHETYQFIVKGLRKEYGVFVLSDGIKHDQGNYFSDYYTFLGTAPTERFLDAMELGMRAIETVASEWNYCHENDAAKLSEEAIKEINYRFRENGFGYEYIDGKIIRVDSAFLHAEVTKPALALLRGKIYAGAQEEYLSAHQHYKESKYKEAIVDCLKSFESTMKAICDKRRWAYAKNSATAKELINICIQNALIPAYWQNNVNSLRSLLESSVPTGRNKVAGHGQGTDPKQVEEPIVRYIMHMTGATILFLAEAERELP
ncbi:hypothetical protein CN205_24135 [Sinorhizobium meliloti]|uniref:STM4504/CBY_0614 family protein n=1 Tax=Rhizobium meliloti TaxID=382 RepID=UPI000FD6DF5E|nr:hypothetical protein [Sinorhizobium meliloti]RVI03195.1 hypothetical protein CN205_24135 [Sinorhizobium meliloti]